MSVAPARPQSVVILVSFDLVIANKTTPESQGNGECLGVAAFEDRMSEQAQGQNPQSEISD